MDYIIDWYAKYTHSSICVLFQNSNSTEYNIIFWRSENPDVPQLEVIQLPANKHNTENRQEEI